MGRRIHTTHETRDHDARDNACAEDSFFLFKPFYSNLRDMRYEARDVGGWTEATRRGRNAEARGGADAPVVVGQDLILEDEASGHLNTCCAGDWCIQRPMSSTWSIRRWSRGARPCSNVCRRGLRPTVQSLGSSNRSVPIGLGCLPCCVAIATKGIVRARSRQSTACALPW